MTQPIEQPDPSAPNSELLRSVLGSHADKATITVAEAGRLLGLGRSSAYEAVRRGEIPSLSIGRRLVVPVPALARLLLGELPSEVVDSSPQLHAV